MNDDNNNESTKGGSAVPTSQALLLKTLEDMLHDRIAKKKVDTQKCNEISETEKIWTEIETLHWVLSESRSIRRRLEAQ